MFQKIAKHRANDASNDVHRPPLPEDLGKDNWCLEDGGASFGNPSSADFLQMEEQSMTLCSLPGRLYICIIWSLLPHQTVQRAPFISN